MYFIGSKIYISYFKLFIFIIIISFTHQQHAYERGVCIVPCADLIAEPVHNVKQYANIPISVKKFDPICPRIYQLLFNETVEIIEYKNNEVLISLPHVFYQREHEIAKNTKYWTVRTNIISMNELGTKGVDNSLFPSPISFSKPHSTHKNTVSLTQPFHDSSSGTTFSAGTRFTMASQPSKKNVAVYVYDNKHRAHTIKNIPTNKCIVQKNIHKEQCKQQFVNLLNTWAHPSSGFIPYVLGGSSFSSTCHNSFGQQPNNNNIIYSRNEAPTFPYTGLDCASLIVRAAQIVGIPFYYKNSITIARNLKPMSKSDAIEAGDIIWIPGHVMIVSSIDKGLLIEARSYEHGYGKVHEIPLHKEFKNIHNYHDLLDAYFNHKPLQRLDSQGTLRQTITDLKILKLESVWNT